MWKFFAWMIIYLISGAALASVTAAADYPVHADWMKSLDDTVPITQLSIPGTHDSATDYQHCEENYACSQVIDFASTQTYPINDQLQMGIRFFDIRLAYEDDSLRFHHGALYLEQHFSDALDWAQDFLKKHPSEFVIFLIKQEYNKKKVSVNEFWKKITDEFSKYPSDLFYLQKSIPTVGEARGKIIIMARDEADYPQGYHVEWDSNTSYYLAWTGGDLGKKDTLIYIVEDHYSLWNVATITKFIDIRHNLALARLCPECSASKTLFITFISGEGDPLHTPAHYADYENAQTSDWLVNTAPRGPRSGIVNMDYAGDPNHYGDEMLEAVIGQNHPYKVPGFLGDNSEGGGITAADVNGNGKPDLIAFNIDNPTGENGGYYRIGWDLDENGNPSSWLAPQSIPWQGDDQQGGGITATDVNGDGTPDLIVFMIDNPQGDNHGYYRIGYMDPRNGGVTGWTDFKEIPGGFGTESQGGGVTALDINGNGKPDLIAFNIDNPAGENGGYYRIGWDLDAEGNPSSWLAPQSIPWQGNDQQGGGITATDMNGDGTPDLIVFMIDNPDGPNHVWYRIGYMDKSTGVVSEWTDFEMVPGWFGNESAGGGTTVTDINHNGKPDLIVFYIDDPDGENSGYYRILWDLQNPSGSIKGGKIP